MNASLRNLSFAAAVLLAVSFLAICQAHAQAEQGIQIKPAVIEGNIDPGATYDYSVRVTNISDTEQTFYLTTQDIKDVTAGGQPIFSDENEKTPYELSQWISLGQAQITLGPKEEKSISFTVTVPKDASPGSHFAGIFLDSQPAKLHTNGSSVGMKVGPIISLRVAGNATEDAQLREFSTSHIVYGSAADVQFNTKITNLGNTLVRPRGVIEITDMRGSKIDVLKVNDSASGVFPSGDKIFTNAWSYDNFAFGRYQAVVSLTYGDEEKKTVSAATSFWVLPLKPLLTVLGSVFGGLLLLYVLVRMYIASKIREMGGGRGSDLYSRRNQSPVPRLLVITLAILFLAILFLVLLFLLFA